MCELRRDSSHKLWDGSLVDRALGIECLEVGGLSPSCPTNNRGGSLNS